MKKLSILAMTGACAIALTSCGGNGGGNATGYTNKETPLILSTADVDRVFNPFFATNAADSTIAAMTQINMIGNDSKGNPTYGDDHAVVVKDYQIVRDEANDTSTYKFVLKNNVKFSNGSPLTIKDVLFNFYVYLDPAYSGSSTIYSTDIVGLKEYRTQEIDEASQDMFMEGFKTTAKTRVDKLIEAIDLIKEENPDKVNYSYDELKDALAQYTLDNSSEVYAHLVEDYEKASDLFKEEMASDYTNSLDVYEDFIYKYKDKSTGEEVKLENIFQNDMEMFLYNYNYIKISDEDGEISTTIAENGSTLEALRSDFDKIYAEANATDENSKKEALKTHYLDLIYNGKFTSTINTEILYFWNTATNLKEYIANMAMEEQFKGQDRDILNISGIKFANKTSSVEVNGKTYEAPTYDANGAVTSGNEVLSITLNGVDPKAIWNFSIPVCPMYYYSDKAHIDAFDYEANFGVEYGSITFMNEVIQETNKLQVPVGAGAYMAADANHNTENVTPGDFYDKGIIYFRANPNYIAGEPKITKVRYVVVSSTNTLNSLYANSVDFVQPNCKPEIVNELNGKKSEGINNTSIKASGYGYIGINSKYVKSLFVRQAIMHAIDTDLTIDYYGAYASPIYRSMSKASEYYPTGCNPYYPKVTGNIPSVLLGDDEAAIEEYVCSPYYKEWILDKKAKGEIQGQTLTDAQQDEFLQYLVCDLGGYRLSNGVLQNSDGKLKFTFTIAGQEEDHPAFLCFLKAEEILERIGFDITVTTDAQALKKLSTGKLQVWAAAWSSTIDPDMYQVYHMDSKATSVKNWGYDAILDDTNKYSKEYSILLELSQLVEEGRSTTVKEERQAIYREALDKVMELAIELPTYQRDDLFAYNANKINESSLNKSASPYDGLLSKMHTISLNEEK